MAKTIILSMFFVLVFTHLLINVFRPELLGQLSWWMVRTIKMDNVFSKEVTIERFTNRGQRAIAIIVDLCFLAVYVVLWRLGPP